MKYSGIKTNTKLTKNKMPFKNRDEGQAWWSISVIPAIWRMGIRRTVVGGQPRG
jgi:hypothetical protein